MWERIKDFFSADKPLKVLVVGDVMLDTYIRGTVDRISPEAPVQVLEWDGVEENVPGGAGNVARNLAVLGCTVYLLGTVGTDSNGRDRGAELKSLLLDEGVNIDNLISLPDRPTTHKIRVIAHNQQVIRIDREKNTPLGEEVISEFLRRIKKIVPLVDGVICSDYAKGMLVPELMAGVLREAELYGKPVVVDPKGRDYSKYFGCAAITPNEKELFQATGMDVSGEANLEEAARKLMDITGCRSVMVTRGGRGICLLERDGAPQQIPAEAREVYDVTGAGDTVVGVFGMALFGGLSPAEAASVANAAGGLAVGKLGTSVVKKEEILHHFRNRELTAGGKVVEAVLLEERLEKERHRGKKVVFTNGCFDPIHKGHVSLLEQAAKLGDILIVGLNSDSSVRKLKGDSRPSVTQEDRAYILGALEAVDYVIIFDEPTPEDLIRMIKPNYLVKGSDYRLEEVVGRELVESNGGEVKLIPLVPDRSSSAFIESIVERNRSD